MEARKWVILLSLSFSLFPPFLNPSEALGARGDILPHRECPWLARAVPGAAAAEQEEAVSGGTVLLRHEVVEHRVDGGAQVAQHHGDHVEVLAQARLVVVVGVREEVAADVVGQPADGEGQDHHGWRG